MEKITINGGRALSGNIDLQGSKNAALPIIFATILAEGTSVLHNVPNISDVDIALRILKGFGAEIDISESTVTICTERLVYKAPQAEYVSKIRASTYLLGACLARFGIAEIMNFGGCNFGSRPIDIHLFAAKELGGIQNGNLLLAKRLVGKEIKLPKKSVGATINTLLMAARAEGITKLSGFAREPHVMALLDFLVSLGVEIEDLGDTLIIKGGSPHSGETTIIPDMIEAGTYMLLSPLCGGAVTVPSFVSSSLSSFLALAAASGMKVLSEGGRIWFSGVPNSEIHVITEPYPAFATDFQPQMCPLMAKFMGGCIEERVWLDRFAYLTSLEKFGVNYTRHGSIAEIYHSEMLSGDTCATDLRGGAACILSALSVKGESNIYNPDVILRGYSSLIDKLTMLGADIKII